MTIPLKLLLSLSVVSMATGQGVDQTLVPGVTGQDVVEASVTLIQGSCNFENDYLFLRRWAFVISNNGESPTQSSGGIWEISHANFLLTKVVPGFNYATILSDFGVNWASATYDDLKKPMYSCIAAMLLIQKLGAVPKSVAGQSAVFAAHLGGNAQQYVREANAMDFGCGPKAVDVAFVLDASGSVVAADYVRSKDFTADIVQGFNLGPDKVRVAVLEFSYSVWAHISFLDNTNINNRINSIPKHDGGTDTAMALNYLRTTTFTAAHGSRKGAKIAIIQTDGKSKDKAATIAAAALLRATGVIVFAIGLGTGIGKAELDAIATPPVCTHVRMLDGYTDLAPVLADIQQAACGAEYVVEGNTTTDLNCNAPQTIQIKVGDVVSILTFPDTGVLNIYGSYLTTKPNQALNDFTVTAQNNKPNVLYLVGSTKDLYLTITSTQSSKCNGSFLFETEEGNGLIKTGASNLCVKDNKVVNCTDEDYITSVDHKVVDKNTLPECQSGPGYYAHPTSTTKYIYCTAGNNAYIVDCPTGFQYLPTVQDCVAPADPQDPCPVCTAFNWKRGIRKFPVRGQPRKYVDCTGPLTCQIETCRKRYIARNQQCKNPKVKKCPKYDIKTAICCSGQVYARANYGKAECCRGQIMDRKIQRCCAKTINSITGMKRPRCCNDVAYDAKTHMCKRKKVGKKPGRKPGNVDPQWEVVKIDEPE